MDEKPQDLKPETEEARSDEHILSEKSPTPSFYFFQTKKRKILFFSGIAFLILALVLTAAFIALSLDDSEEEPYPVTTEEIAVFSPETEERGVYIATVSNLNFPSCPGLSEEALKEEIDAILSVCKDTGFRTVYFQVRPSGDALYDSEIFPTSRYLAEKEGGEISFDPLLYLTGKARSFGLDVVAWVNPYRITAFSSKTKEDALNALSEKNPARLHPDWCVFYDGKLYYDPALPEVRALIADGVRELCENYEISGILYDDYFYPYPVEGEKYDDSASYLIYGQGQELSDWRRENVNQMIKKSFDTVKSVSDQLSFGVSPFGIWQNASSHPKGSLTGGLEAYSALYCDALAWIRGGYVDYIAPQLYWERDHSVASFTTLAKWWSRQVKGTGVKLYISHAAYRASDFSSGEIQKQIEYSRRLPGFCGSIHYGFADVAASTNGIREELQCLYREEYQEEV